MAELARAYFIRIADEGGSGGAASDGAAVGDAPADVPAAAVAVQFNPMSLQYGLTINNPQPGQRPDATQYAGRGEATLDLDLVFDTTPQGTDVRRHTVPVRNLGLASDPAAGAGGGDGGGAGAGTTAANLTPSKVAFVWGTFRFVGVVASFRETLDFFSAEGVPLRSGVHVSLRGTQNSEVFTEPPRQAGLGSGLGDLGRSIDSLSRSDASGARAAGAALGAASLRVGLSAGGGAGGSISLGASVSVGATLPAGALAGLASVHASATVAAPGAALAGPFGFGGRVQGSAPSGLTARLGVLDFSEPDA